MNGPSTLHARVCGIYAQLVADTNALSRSLDEGSMSTQDMLEGEAQHARQYALCIALTKVMAATDTSEATFSLLTAGNNFYRSSSEA